MLNKGMSRPEIESELMDKGDFVQIDYLTNFLEENMSIDMKKFIFERLAKIYEKLKMFTDAAKMYDNLAKISVAFSVKIENHVKEIEMFIKAGKFVEADEAMKKAMGEANASEKQEIYREIRDFYIRQAESYEMDLQRNHALEIYEKALRMQMNDEQSTIIKVKIDILKEKLGMK
jgi:tetratricopeptide (TPR) repeat protein